MRYTNLILPHYTYDDYVHWEGRWELIAGHPIARMPSDTPHHQMISGLVSTVLSEAIKETGCKKCKVYCPVDYKVANDTVIQSDVLIICGEPAEAFLDFPPVLVVEILSPSTALRDRYTKFEIYESSGVRYYIIVDIDKEIFEVYELKEEKYVLLENDFDEPIDFALDEECTISVILNEVW
ncbi:MAG: Uma2 family endonuclease [Bacteroidota bacterium]